MHSAGEAEQKGNMGQGQTRGAGKRVHNILGQESEQRNQPSCPRARLEFMPGFSFLVPSANGRTAMEDTYSSLRQQWSKEASHIIFSMAISGMLMQEADQIKWSTWQKPVGLTCEMPPHRIRVYEWETSLERHKAVSSHPHPLLPTFPNWKKMMSKQSIRRGGPQSISGNRERDVGSKTGRWQLKANGV